MVDAWVPGINPTATGQPVGVRASITAYEDVLDVDHLVVRIYFEGMDRDDVMGQLELLCEEVAPGT